MEEHIHKSHEFLLKTWDTTKANLAVLDHEKLNDANKNV